MTVECVHCHDEIPDFVAIYNAAEDKPGWARIICADCWMAGKR